MNHIELDQYLEIIKVCLIESGAKINKWREKSMLEKLLAEDKAPWKRWERSVPEIPDYAK